MRYMGLDLGTKSLGIALSDVTGLVATSYKTINFSEGDYKSALEELKPVIDEFRVGKIVLGLPKNMNNTIGPRALETLEFKKLLEEFDIPVVTQDERLSTKEATSYMIDADISRKKRKKKIDSLAASIILQTYLDKERNEKDARK